MYFCAYIYAMKYIFSQYKKFLYPSIIIGLFLLQFLYISPIGEFPLNDDWVHTDTIRYLAATGEFRMLPFAGPTFYVPIWYGFALTKLFGFSFSMLRISTLVLAAMTLLLLYHFVKKITKNELIAFLATLLLWSNPLFYHLSFTFMTDIPALLFFLLSLVVFYKGFERQQYRYLFFASLISIAGFFIRQTNILPMAAAGITAFFLYTPFKYKIKTIAAFGIPSIIFLTLYFYIAHIGLLPQNIGEHSIEGAARLFGHIRWWTWYIPMYLGIFLLPLSLTYALTHTKKFKNNYLYGLVAIFVSAALCFRSAYGLQFPYIRNIITLSGLGPLRDTLQGVPIPLFPSFVWGIITLSAAISAAIVIWIGISERKKITHIRSTHFFITFTAIIYTLPLLIFESFDRYLLPLFVILIIGLSYAIAQKKYTKIQRYIPLILCIIFSFIVSMTQTDYYLKLHAQKNIIANTLLENGIEINEIDAGYEWDGWHQYWSMYDSNYKAPDSKDRPWWITKLFPKNTAQYVIAISPLKNYDIVETYHITHVLNPNNTLYLLKKMTN